MEQKTKVHAEIGKQELLVTREFDLSIELLFEAFAKSDLIEQWMGTKVIKMESKNHGSFEFETTDLKGNKYYFNGVIHTFDPNKRIIRTFEMGNMAFGVQLEILDFEKLSETRSSLNKKVIYESVSHRDANLKLPFTYGINMAHNRLEEAAKNYYKTP